MGTPRIIAVTFAAGAVVAASVSGVTGSAPPSQAATAVAWSQFGNGPSHTGVNNAESSITPSTVGSLRPLFTATLPGPGDGEPVLQPGVTTSSGTKDLLFVTTKDGWIAALDAASGASVWSHQYGAGACRINGGSTACYTTSSPAIDPSGASIYAYGLDGKVHKYATGTGVETKDASWPEVATLKPSDEKSSPALTIATAGGHTYLYVSNGGYPGDRGDYQGHVTTIDLADGTQHVFNSLCSNLTVHFAPSPATDCANVQSAVWARPSVVFDQGTGRVLFSTGNSVFDGNRNWGDTVLAINPDGTGTNGAPVDSYTPSNQAELNQKDLDLGSTAPQVVAPPAGSSIAHLAVQSGKDAMLRLLNTANLSGSGGPGHQGGELQLLPVPQGGQVLTEPANWVDPASGTSWVLVANGNGISGLKLQAGAGGAPALVLAWTSNVGGTSPIVAGGVLFYESKNGIRALDPKTGTELWSDTAGSSPHWQSPIVANGRLYFEDNSGKLHAYALPATAEKVGRLAGSDRFGTSAAVSAATFASGAPVAYVASGVQFPDALSGSAAASRAGGPMLLVSPGAIPPPIRDELSRLRPGRIVVLGGDASVSATVEAQLKSFTAGAVTRVNGSDRFETAAAVSRATSSVSPPVAYVVSGEAFPDALGAGALAARTAGAPVLLTTSWGVPAATTAELKRVHPASIVVVGGPAAVSDGVLNALKADTSGSVSRLAGADRYDTSAAVAAAFPAGGEETFAASGVNFPDALSASAAAGDTRSALLLTAGGAVPDPVAAQLTRLGPSHIALVGGTDAVSDAVQAALAAYVK